MTEAWLGKYRVIAELGRGGMADVVLAMARGPTGSGFVKLTVIKRLRANLVDDPDFVAMLVDEARISARLNHPNVVQTVEVGLEDDEYFMAMEYLDGQPLHRIQRRALKRGIPLPRDVEYMVVRDALAGLHYAHELADYDGSPLDIVHRDVTPQNVFVTYEGQIKVVDFGIAKAAGRGSETQHGIVKGKVRYMSPEQAMGKLVDRRSDVFAAGVLLWEAATAQRFWPQPDQLTVVQALIHGEYDASPRAVDPSIPEAIDRICVKALAQGAADRYATAAEMQMELDAYFANRAATVRRTIGPLVAELFAPERAEMQQIIQRAGSANRERPNSSRLRLAAAASAGPSVAASAASSSPEEDGATLVMDARPPVPRAEPVHVPARAEAQVVRRSASRVVLVGMALATSAVLALVATAISANREAATTSSRVAAVASFLTTPSGSELRMKDPHAVAPPPEAATEPPSRAMVTPRSTPRATWKPSRVAAPPASVSRPTAPHAADSSQVNVRPRSGASIDVGDPWADTP